MTTSRRNTEIGPLLQVLCAHDAEGKTDGQLLEQFLAGRNESAFAALLLRHGPMVLGVCRRVLGNATDTEDAFQATFLVLLRKAASLTSRCFLGDWLHGVARHVALDARRAAARRRTKEKAIARPEARAEAVRDDRLPFLDAELSRLPEKYRLPIVLCDLEGKTRQQAAGQLGWPEGTVAGRLARGRALLARRLLRRGSVVSSVLPGALAASAAQAAMPRALVHATVQIVALVAAGQVTPQSVLSLEALTLAQGVMRSMFWQKIKIGALAVLAAVLITAGGGLTFHVLAGEGQQPNPTADKPSVAPAVAGQSAAKKAPTAQDEALGKAAADQKVRTARYEALVKAAQDQYTARWEEYVVGKTTVDFLITSGLDLLKARLRLSDKKAEKETAYQEHLTRMKDMEKIAKAKYDLGTIPATQYFQTVYHRIEAEIWLDEIQTAK